jgi:putative sterol carrier protein
MSTVKINKPEDLIQGLAKNLATEAGKKVAGGINARFSFKISGGNGGEWTAYLNAEDPHLTTGLDPAAECKIECSDETLVSLINGESTPVGLFLRGKLKVSNKALAGRLAELADLV